MDAVSRDYLLLSLGLGRLQEGIVDSYYGPPEIVALAEERAASADQLALEAAELRGHLAGEPDRQRAHWLERQLVALETLASRLAGEEIEYLEEVERCFDARPSPTPDRVYDEAHGQLDNLLAPGDDLRQRVEDRGRRLVVPPDRLPAVLDWLVERVRAESLRHFPAPAGESLEVTLVAGQPWSAYNWYHGGLRSRVEVNTDLPVRATDLIGLMTHECFPGHHLEHAWKEQRLYREQGRGEASVLLINTPEAFVSEGLAEVGGRLVIDAEGWQDLLADICRLGGIGLEPGEPARQLAISRALNGLRAVAADASLMLHGEGRPRSEVQDFIEQRALRSPEQAAKTLEFIAHPLWRTYVFCYSGGDSLLTAWCAEAGDEAAQRSRFFRLLTEQLTPSGLAAELTVAG